MRKVSFAAYGGPEVLRLTEAEEPRPGPGRIRIAVRAAGVNPVDWRIREGQKLGAHPPAPLPAGLGLDAAGVVDEVGEGVEGVRPGDRVFGEGHETYAESAVLSAWAPMPEGLSFAEAAGYPSVMETALRVPRRGRRPPRTAAAGERCRRRGRLGGAPGRPRPGHRRDRHRRARQPGVPAEPGRRRHDVRPGVGRAGAADRPRRTRPWTWPGPEWSASWSG